MKKIYLLVKKQLFLSIFTCFISFYYSHAQQRGIGLTYDFSTRRVLKHIKPYYFKQYKQGKRFNEWYFHSYHKLRETAMDSATIYNTNNTSHKEAYTLTKKYDDFRIGHTRNIRVGSFLNHKLNLWLGLRFRVSYSRSLLIPTENKGHLSKIHSVLMGVSANTTVSYQATPRLFFGLSMQPSSSYFFSYGYRYFEHLNFPIINSNSWHPDIRIATYWKAIPFTYNLSARYTIKQKEEPTVVIPLKPSKTYTGFGINANLNAYVIDVHYDSFDWSTVYPGNAPWKIDYGINVFRIKNDRKRFEELYLGKFFAEKGNIIYTAYIAKDTINQFLANRNYFGGSLGYSRYNKIKKISNRIVDFYVGTNTELAFLKENAKPSSNKGYNLSRTKFDFRIFASATALWKCSERFYIETRWRPHLAQSFIIEHSKGDGVFDPNYGGKTNSYFFTHPRILDPSFQLGIRYVTKVDKPKKVKKGK